jgi:hypothetical protein
MPYVYIGGFLWLAMALVVVVVARQRMHRPACPDCGLSVDRNLPTCPYCGASMT